MQLTSTLTTLELMKLSSSTDTATQVGRLGSGSVTLTDFESVVVQLLVGVESGLLVSFTDAAFESGHGVSLNFQLVGEGSNLLSTGICLCLECEMVRLSSSMLSLVLTFLQ